MIDIDLDQAEKIDALRTSRAATDALLSKHEQDLEHDRAIEARLPLCINSGVDVRAYIAADRVERYGVRTRAATLGQIEQSLRELKSAGLWPLSSERAVSIEPLAIVGTALAMLRSDDEHLERLRPTVVDGAASAVRLAVDREAKRQRVAAIRESLKDVGPEELERERPGAANLWRRLVAHASPINGRLPPVHGPVRACPDLTQKVCDLADELPRHLRVGFQHLQGAYEFVVAARARGEHASIEWPDVVLRVALELAPQVARHRSERERAKVIAKYEKHLHEQYERVREEIRAASQPKNRTKESR